MADPDLADLARVVREGVGRLNWRMRAERGGESTLVLAVLSRLHRAGTQTPKEVSDGEKIQPQSLTRVLAAMERDGLVSRRPDPDDRRRSLLDITQSGLAALRSYSERRERWLAAAMAETLTETEQELLRLAAKVMMQLADS
ncbi:DNA-binding MarR family transcriptional regulator [Amycolatopsis bartoniae]|uniref:MarR family transcriptional regulator n=1 Tax=Amycolatopsis bartoniae TaxID=941986 RepID=A0A8H9IWI9_9PSEU|nr:MarR family transcriptional regulator [Amycolatopsis bartoniae]MBB2935940.1 DNA-binding MarR family transcriptional regulator [Amycolatopsis bartoniae]TVS99082.1 MarR family transcriptional regulator [Amycolatopsis bartoniae]GHF62947.1 MarR family transcriptional regulator [Amycolatopsis bartoniae]